jgi:hypothetical protein
MAHSGMLVQIYKYEELHSACSKLDPTRTCVLVPIQSPTNRNPKVCLVYIQLHTTGIQGYH